MENLPIELAEITAILSHFPVAVQDVTDFCNSSRGAEDVRWNFIFGRNYVLKINTPNGMWEKRLQEIDRLTARYRSVGVYCPSFIPTKSGALSHTWVHKSKTYICFVEEFAKYPAYEWDAEHNRKETVEHLGRLAAKYTDVDLSEIRSMWSIIDLAPFDTDVDEKQENADTLIGTLREFGCAELAERVVTLNTQLRAAILPHFRQLPRCVFQGDLNNSNLLHENGKFVGLIDFNCSGTDVNINVFINETNWFPDEKQFHEMTISELLEHMDCEHRDTVSAILQHYTLNDMEKQMYPYFKRITDLFQYPNVCQMVRWLKDDAQRDKCTKFIKVLIEQPL